MRRSLWPALAALFLSLPAVADQGIWSEIPPGERRHHACALLPLGQAIVFGGITQEGESNEVFMVGLGGPPTTWTRIATTGTPPSPRYGASAVYSTSASKVYVFGGISNGIYLNDLWQLDLSTHAWTLLDRGPPPAPRAFHTAVYDGEQMIVYGGQGAGSVDLGDTWSLRDFGLPLERNWKQLAPVGGPPPARHGHAAAMWTGGGLMFVWGGSGAGVTANVWVLSFPGFGSPPEWVAYPFTGTPPSARSGHAAVFDNVRNRLVIFGGGDPPLNDVHAFDYVSTAWATLTPAPSPQIGAPPPRRYHTAVLEGFSVPRMVVYGGEGAGSSMLADTWWLDLSTPSGQWTALTPTARRGHTMVYDSDGPRMLMFGGFDGVEEKQDTWALELAGGAPAWRQIVTPNAPPAREQHAATWCFFNDQMLIFGGRAGGTLMNDVWTLNAGSASPDWSPLSPQGDPPSPRAGHSMLSEDCLHAFVFGGTTGPGAWSDETWQLNFFPPGSWAPMSPTGMPPSPRAGHSAVLYSYPSDVDELQMVVVAGEGAELEEDTRQLVFNQNQWIARPMSGPGPRAYAGVGRYGVQGRTVLFGGRGPSGPLSDTWWAPLVNSQDWQPLPTTGGPPGAREMSALAVQRAAGAQARALLFGGEDGAGVLGDLWQLDFEGVPLSVAPLPPGADLQLPPVTPNPSRGAGRAVLDLPHAAHVRAAVYDVAGRRVRGVIDGRLEAGRRELSWSLGEVAAGIYVLRVEVDGAKASRRFAVIR